MYFWYMPCLTRFSTATTTVFCILFETTTPVLVVRLLTRGVSFVSFVAMSIVP